MCAEACFAALGARDGAAETFWPNGSAVHHARRSADVLGGPAYLTHAPVELRSDNEEDRERDEASRAVSTAAGGPIPSAADRVRVAWMAISAILSTGHRGGAPGGNSPGQDG